MKITLKIELSSKCKKSPFILFTYIGLEQKNEIINLDSLSGNEIPNEIKDMVIRFIKKRYGVTNISNEFWKYAIYPFCLILVALSERCEEFEGISVNFSEKVSDIPWFCFYNADNVENTTTFFHRTSFTMFPLIADFFDAKTKRVSTHFRFLLRRRCLTLIDGIVLSAFFILPAIFRKLKSDRLTSINVCRTYEQAHRSFDVGIQNIFIPNVSSLKKILFGFKSSALGEVDRINWYRAIVKTLFSKSNSKSGCLCYFDNDSRLLLFYSNYLTSIIKSYPELSRVNSFEMVGQYASKTQEICQENGVALTRYQTATINPVQVYILSVFGKFIPRNMRDYDLLNDKFQGQVCLPNKKKEYKVESRSKKILICTQPYAQGDFDRLLNHFNTMKIYEQYSVFIRIHPRDNYTYRKFDWLVIDREDSSLKSIKDSRLVIGKTTSMLDDAIDYGVNSLSLCMDPYTLSLLHLLSNEVIVVKDLSEIDTFIEAE